MLKSFQRLHRLTIVAIIVALNCNYGFLMKRSLLGGKRSDVISPVHMSDGIIYNPEDGPDDDVMRPVDVLPTVSQDYNFGEVVYDVKYDLWIAGCGTLGEYILKQWRDTHPTDSIIAETKTPQRHEKLSELGVTCRLRSERVEEDHHTAKTVIIAIPPSASDDYAEEMHSATQLWAGPDYGGSLVLTSSIGVYGASNGNIVNEEFRIDSRSKGSYRMLCAEEAVINRGGNIMRLAGLYTESRGAHTFWLRKAKQGLPIESNPDGLVNLLHYEDAAAATVALARAPEYNKTVFLATDNEVLTRQEICDSALASKLFPDASTPEFLEATGPLGKTCDSSVTRSQLKWEPKHSSFRVFMRRLGGEDIQPVESPFKPPQDTADGDGTGTTDGDSGGSGLWIPGDDDDDLF